MKIKDEMLEAAYNIMRGKWDNLKVTEKCEQIAIESMLDFAQWLREGYSIYEMDSNKELPSDTWRNKYEEPEKTFSLQQLIEKYKIELEQY